MPRVKDSGLVYYDFNDPDDVEELREELRGEAHTEWLAEQEEAEQEEAEEEEAEEE